MTVIIIDSFLLPIIYTAMAMGILGLVAYGFNWYMKRPFHKQQSSREVKE